MDVEGRAGDNGQVGRCGRELEKEKSMSTFLEKMMTTNVFNHDYNYLLDIFSFNVDQDLFKHHQMFLSESLTAICDRLSCLTLVHTCV